MTTRRDFLSGLAVASAGLALGSTATLASQASGGVSVPTQTHSTTPMRTLMKTVPLGGWGTPPFSYNWTVNAS
ncbi:twin-arginine translocation signal domain-containing protein [Pseudomonas sp. LFS044]|uniref:twin-arginine translocation signal domain-containing protein n=1 Tax=Pseudomonas sp. LFS044 TaxID=3229880 RepID=UPI003A8068DA